MLSMLAVDVAPHGELSQLGDRLAEVDWFDGSEILVGVVGIEAVPAASTRREAPPATDGEPGSRPDTREPSRT
jgi:hypothetical protein